MIRTQKRNHKKHNNGFTLVEMIVTMLLLSILLTISVVGLMAWQDWSDFNQANEYAETMFLASQNQLSEYSANGTLDKFAKRAYDGSNQVTLSEIYYEEGVAYSEDTVWTSGNKGTLVFVRCNRGDYALYTNGQPTVSPSAPIVFELLEGYLYDTSLLNDTICIEFSLEDGQVFSVSYCAKADSDGNESFVYDNSNDSKVGQVNIATRYEDYRRERLVGYYGVDSLSKAISGKKEKPAIEDVMLHNEETLNLTYRVSKPENTAKMTFDIVVYDMDDNFRQDENMPEGVPVLKITLKGAMKNKLNQETQMCPIVRYVKNESGEWETQELGDFPILAWIEEDGSVRVILDAADYQATSASYAENLSMLKDAAKAQFIKASDFTFKSTYSFHRFGLDAGKIMCRVKGYSASFDTTTERQSNTSFVYFEEETADTESEVASYQYTIANARHLYNMRYVTDLRANTQISEDQLKLSSLHYAQDKQLACKFLLTEDINWDAFAEEGYFYNTGGNKINVPEDYEDDFVSMKQLRIEDSFDGDEHTISGLTITQAGNELSSLYPDETGEGENAGNIRKPVGLFASNYGVISNLTLDKIQVTSAGDYVGAICGVTVCGTKTDGGITGILSNLQVQNSGTAEEESFVKGVDYVGGIMGSVEGLKNLSDHTELGFGKLKNSAKLSGRSYLGGIVGELRVPKDKNAAIILSDCENYGALLNFIKSGDKREDSRFIGGIAGLCANEYGAANPDSSDAKTGIRLVNCNSSSQYSETDLYALLGTDSGMPLHAYDSEAIGIYVGGIVGYSSYSTIQNANTASKDGEKGYVFGYQYVGGIAGYMEGTGVLSGLAGDAQNRNVNESYVIGCRYVGGITGANALPDETAIRTAAGDNTGTLLSILEDSDVILEVDDVVETGRELSGWVNTGVVYATDSYAGGICGYNTGWIYNCNNRVGETTITGLYPVSTAGDYAGGIAGYNSGVIGNTLRTKDGSSFVAADNTAEAERLQTTVPFVVGKDYVGGIVGYNAGGAVVEDYAVKGGRIVGDVDASCYVGGIAGCNQSILMLQHEDGTSRTLSAAPQEVTGKYYVGGSIGGNIINTNGYAQNMVSEAGSGGSSDIATDSSAGQTSDKCYVTLTRQSVGWNETSAQFEYYIHNDSDQPITDWHLVFHVTAGTTRLWGPYNTDDARNEFTETTFTFYGSATNGTKQIAPGGTVNSTFGLGFPDYASLYSFDVTDIEFFYDGGDGNQTTKLPGNVGITERNRHVVSMNDETYTCRLEGTYNGWNYFSIKNNSNEDIIDWTIEIPVADAENVEAGSYAGFTVERKSREEGGSLYEYWELVPTDTAQNLLRANAQMTTGQAIFTVNSEESFERMKENMRFVFYTTKLQQQVEEKQYARIYASCGMEDFAGSVNASAFSGGFIGYNLLVNSTDKAYAPNITEELRNLATGRTAEDTAEEARKIAVQTSTAQLYVQGEVGAGTVDSELYAGGLLGYNHSLSFLYIVNGDNKAGITAKGGYAGGIISTNDARDNKLENCINTGNVRVDSGMAGGMTARNRGKILICTNKNNIIYAQDAAGGIAGENTGSVSESSVVADVIGANGMNQAAYGGIIGISGLESGKDAVENADAASVTECYFDGTVSAAGVGVTAKIGGIVGVNGGNSTIKACAVGADDTEHNTSVLGGVVAGTIYADAVSDVGGIAGRNYGDIISCDNKQYSSDAVLIENYAGHTGGIVGHNCALASVTGNETERLTTGADWAVNGRKCDTDTALGGIAGKSESSVSMEYTDNYAIVTITSEGEAAAGGLIGELDYTAEETIAFKKCNNYGAITGNMYTGGLVGWLRGPGADFASCSNDGDVSGGQYTGAMIGKSEQADAMIAFTDCTVKGNNYIYQAAFAQIESQVQDLSQTVSDLVEETVTEEQTEISEAADVEDIEDSTQSDASMQEPALAEPVEAEVYATPELFESEPYVLSFQTEEEVGYYRMQIRDTNNAAAAVYLEPVKDGYIVYYAGPRADIKQLSHCMENPYTKVCGILTEKDAVELPYHIDYEAEDGTVVPVAAKLLYEDGEIHLELPDVLRTVKTDVQPESVRQSLTELVTVQAMIDEELIGIYDNSSVIAWKHRIETATKTDAAEENEQGEIWIGEVDVISDETDVPEVIGTHMLVGDLTDGKQMIKYTITAKKPLMMQIVTEDSQGDIIISRYSTIPMNQTEEERFVGIFMADKEELFAENSHVKIRFAEIREDGTADWTDFYTLTDQTIEEIQ